MTYHGKTFCQGFLFYFIFLILGIYVYWAILLQFEITVFYFNIFCDAICNSVIFLDQLFHF